MKIIFALLTTLSLLVSSVAYHKTDQAKVVPQAQEALGGTNAVGGKTYYLSGAGASASQTTLSLTNFDIAGGTQNLTMTDFGTLGCGTLEPGHATRQEFVSFTGVTQNADGTATLSGVSRGLAPIPPYTASSTLQDAHAGGSQFVISNSPPCFYESYANRTASTTIQALWNFAVLPESPLTATTSNQLTNKSYVDNVVNAGAATSTETNGGLVELGTLAEQASSFDGGANKPTVLQTKNSTSTCQVVGTYNIVASSTTGKLDGNCLDRTASQVWTGRNIFNVFNLGIGTSTPGATLSVQGRGLFAHDVFASFFTATSTTANTFPYASTTALTVSTTASTTDLIVSGTTTGGPMTYTASSTNFAPQVTYTGVIPANANIGLIKWRIVDSSCTPQEVGVAVVARSGLTAADIASNGGATCDGEYALTWSGSNLVVSETSDDSGDSTISGTVYWYK